MIPESETPHEPVATGDRRDEVRLEPDSNQLVRMRATFRPEGPLPPQEQSEAAEIGLAQARPPVEDVAVAKPGPSVWDARPADDATGSAPDDLSGGREVSRTAP